MTKSLIILTVSIILLSMGYISFTNFLMNDTAIHSSTKRPINTKYIQMENALLTFLDKKMMGPDGSVLTTTKGDGESRYTLSESIGILLNYSVMTKRKELFHKEYQYLRNNLLHNGKYIRWRADGETAKCNAAVDDLRIIRALMDAYERWQINEYKETADDIQRGILDRQAPDKKIREFYDWNSDKSNNIIPLCYLDLKTMKKLGALDNKWEAVARNGLYTIKRGKINDSLPFYYKYYNYESEQYALDEEFSDDKGVCLTYSVLTAIYLAEVNEDTEIFCKWLKDEMVDGKVYAWYYPNNLKPSDEMESTAVYALGAIYAKLVGEHEMYDKLIDRMVQFAVTDKNSPYYGGFGNPKTGEFYSFDNLMALWALGLNHV